MIFFGGILRTALALVLSLDPDVFRAVWTSVSVAAGSIVIATIIGVPLGLLLAVSQFRLKSSIVTVMNTLVAMPTVVIGLVVYGFISRQGPLGSLGLLFSPLGMVMGQAILATPVVTNCTFTAVTASDSRVIPTALTLGASHFQSMMQLAVEVRFGIIAAITIGFARVISEVGIAMMLGGNIQGYTRTMTTAIALESSKGEFAFALALGIILMTVALAINVVLNFVQQEKHA